MRASTTQCRQAYRNLRSSAMELHSKPFTASDFDEIVKTMVPVDAPPVRWVEAASDYVDLLLVARST
jgi:hypothetical protein